jgi:predicted glycoside hydrolase/deacetylase ChbG (UPF0249 family)
MANGAAFDDAVRVARENPGLGIGIHVSLVGERCVNPPARLRGLVDRNGSLPRTYRSFVAAFLSRKFGVAEIQTEIRAQIAKVLEAGITPTHLDFHQHLHMLPAIFPIALSAAQSSGIRVIRIPLERGRPLGSAARRFQTHILRAFCTRNGRRLAETGLKSPGSFHGFGVSGEMNESNLLATLDRLESGVNEIMVHPGFQDAETASAYPWGYRWQDEYEALISPNVRKRIEECRIRLANFAHAWTV